MKIFEMAPLFCRVQFQSVPSESSSLSAWVLPGAVGTTAGQRNALKNGYLFADSKQMQFCNFPRMGILNTAENTKVEAMKPECYFYPAQLTLSV